MKKFYFVQLWPVGNGSANRVLLEYQAKTKERAIEYFCQRFPLFLLNSDGYLKIDEITYTVCESF